MTTWWIDEETDETYCAECFQHTGASCGGCAHDECRLCNDDDEEDDDEEELVVDKEKVAKLVAEWEKDGTADRLRAARNEWVEQRISETREFLLSEGFEEEEKEDMKELKSNWDKMFEALDKGELVMVKEGDAFVMKKKDE